MTADVVITAISVVVAAALAALIASRQASRELVVKRQLDSTDKFMALVATLDGRPVGGRDVVGRNEQMTAAWLIAGFGGQNTFLRPAAVATLDQFLVDYKDIPELFEAVTEARKLLSSSPGRRGPA